MLQLALAWIGTVLRALVEGTQRFRLVDSAWKHLAALTPLLSAGCQAPVPPCLDGTYEVEFLERLSASTCEGSWGQVLLPDTETTVEEALANDSLIWRIDTNWPSDAVDCPQPTPEDGKCVDFYRARMTPISDPSAQ